MVVVLVEDGKDAQATSPTLVQGRIVDNSRILRVYEFKDGQMQERARLF